MRAVAPKSVNVATGPLVMAALHTTQEVVATGGLPVGGVSGEQIRTLSRMVVPVVAGDVVEVAGWQRVTNDIGPAKYTVGVGYWIDVYDVDDGPATSDPAKVWLRVSSLCGDNVTPSPQRHHMPVVLAGVVWFVPPTWPDRHRAVVCFRADAHSTAWAANGGGDRLTVDDYGVLTVKRYQRAVA